MRFWSRKKRTERSGIGVAHALIAAGAFLWTAGSFAAPLLQAAGAHPAAAMLSRLLYAPMCHQDTERSFWVFGHPLSVCHRCEGIYLAFTAGFFLIPIFGRRVARLRGRKAYLVLFLLPALLDYMLDVAGLHTNTAVTRFVSGATAGAGLALFVATAALELDTERPLRRRISPSL